MPKIDVAALAEDTSCSYPAPFHEIVRGRFRRRIGDAGGLTQFGVNLCRLAPGAASSQRHWHEVEDEMVYVLEGEVVLVDEDGETPLRSGDAATFKSGVANAHQIVNRGDRDALLLEIGMRPDADVVHYADVDMVLRYDPDGDRFTSRAGEPYPARRD